MAYVPAVNTAMVELRMALDGQRIENVVYAERTSAWTTTQLADVGQEVISWWATNMAPSLTNRVVLLEVFCTDLTTQTSPAVSSVPASVTDGAINSEALPNNCAITMSFRTASRGRSARGRNYLAGFASASVSGNIVDSALLADFVTAYELLDAAFSVADAVHVVVSRRHNKANRSTAVMFPVTTYLFVDNIIDSQRKRLPGRGT